VCCYCRWSRIGLDWIGFVEYAVSPMGNERLGPEQPLSSPTSHTDIPTAKKSFFLHKSCSGRLPSGPRACQCSFMEYTLPNICLSWTEGEGAPRLVHRPTKSDRKINSEPPSCSGSRITPYRVGPVARLCLERSSLLSFTRPFAFRLILVVKF